jgi:hypothetical protein
MEILDSDLEGMTERTVLTGTLAHSLLGVPRVTSVHAVSWRIPFSASSSDTHHRFMMFSACTFGARDCRNLFISVLGGGQYSFMRECGEVDPVLFRTDNKEWP